MDRPNIVRISFGPFNTINRLFRFCVYIYYCYMFMFIFIKYKIYIYT